MINGLPLVTMLCAVVNISQACTHGFMSVQLNCAPTIICSYYYARMHACVYVYYIYANVCMCVHVYAHCMHIYACIYVHTYAAPISGSQQFF